jgi:hypothetical protein
MRKQTVRPLKDILNKPIALVRKMVTMVTSIVTAVS